MATSPGGDTRIGTRLAGYRIEEVLGRGGMSVVYLAEDLALGRKVALKLMAPELAQDRRFRERFRLESRLAASLDHPNVIPIYEAGEAEGLLFIAMRYVDGTDLRALLGREAPLEPERALAILTQVAEALDAAHTRGLVHRDVKPSNVLLSDTGEREHAYLADFGLTRTAAAPDTPAEGSRITGTADYMAPEQVVEGVAGPPADVYSLGCVLYQCLTGRTPYPHESEFAVLWAHVDEPPPRPSEAQPALPAALDDVVTTAMAKDPAARYETARHVVDASRAALAREDVGRRRSAWWIAALVLAGLLAAGAALGAFFLTRGETDANAPTVALPGGALQRVDPVTNTLVATYRLGGEPIDVAAGAGAVWVVDGGRNSLARVDPATAEVVRRRLGSGTLAAITTWGTSWVGIAADGPNGPVLTWLDSKTLTVPKTRHAFGRESSTGDPRSAVVTAVGGLEGTRNFSWILDVAAGTLTRLGELASVPPPTSFGKPLWPERPNLELGGLPTSMSKLPGDDLVVATLDGGIRNRGTVVRVDELNGIVDRTPPPFTPAAIAAGDGGVWAVDPSKQRVFSIDLDMIGGVFGGGQRDVSGRPLDVAVGAGAVWVVTSIGRLVRIDPETYEIQAAIDVGANPVGVAVDEHGVWVAVAGGTPLSVEKLPHRFHGQPYRRENLGPTASPKVCHDGRPTRDCFQIVSGRLTGEDGSAAIARFAWHVRRRAGEPLVCQGKAYSGAVTSEIVGDAGTGRLEIERWGTIALNLDRAVFAFDGRGVAARVLCGEQSGTWIGVRGAVRGLSGTFTTPQPYGTVVLGRPTPGATAPHQLRK
jgi:streptogramin lyase